MPYTGPLHGTATMPFTSPVCIGGSTNVLPTTTGSQDINSPGGSIVPQEDSDAQPLDNARNGIYAKNRDPAATWSKVMSRKFSDKPRADVYLRCWMILTHDVVITKSQKFMNQMGLRQAEVVCMRAV